MSTFLHFAMQPQNQVALTFDLKMKYQIYFSKANPAGKQNFLYPTKYQTDNQLVKVIDGI